MERQVLMDRLSEFLMVEQGGWQLYLTAAVRCTDPQLRQRYEEFGRQTARHRAVLIRLVERLGGDPNYVSPTARLAQARAEHLLETALLDALSQEEVEANDLENVLLAETKDHADWQLLGQLARQVDEPEVKQALEDAVREAEPEEDTHVRTARETLAQRELQMVLQGPVPSPARWQQVLSGPVPPIAEIHPAPMGDELLLESARQAAWQESPIVRTSRAG